MDVLRLLLAVLPLALAAAVTPTLIATQLLVVAQGQHWHRRALAVVVANAVGFSVVLGIVLLGFAQLPDAGTGERGGPAAWARLVLGFVLVLSSFWFFLPHPLLAAKVQQTLEGRLDRASVWVFFALALYFSATDFSSFVVLLPAMHDITTSSAVLVGKLLVVFVVLLIALQATLAPALVRIIAGQRVGATMTRAYTWVMRNQFPIVGTVCAVSGAYLMLIGWWRL